MNELTFDEQVRLLIDVRWERIDMPRKFRWCKRLRPYPWLLTAGWHRKWPGLLCVQSHEFKTFRMWEIGIGWIHLWWPRNTVTR